MSNIYAGQTTTTALVQTGDTTGSLVLKTGSTPTTAMTISSSQIVNFANAPTVAGAALPSGAMSLISTITGNNTSNYLTWTGLSGYDKYLLVFENLKPFPTYQQTAFIQLAYGSTTWLTTGYNWTLIYNSNPTPSTQAYSNQSSFNLSGGWQGIGDTGGASGFVYFTGMTNSSQTSVVGQSVNQFGSGIPEGDMNWGLQTNTTAKTGIRIYIPANVYSGSASLYGISS